jgi:hypothetical protein
MPLPKGMRRVEKYDFSRQVLWTCRSVQHMPHLEPPFFHQPQSVDLTHLVLEPTDHSAQVRLLPLAPRRDETRRMARLDLVYAPGSGDHLSLDGRQDRSHSSSADGDR